MARAGRAERVGRDRRSAPAADCARCARARPARWRCWRRRHRAGRALRVPGRSGRRACPRAPAMSVSASLTRWAAAISAAFCLARSPFMSSISRLERVGALLGEGDRGFDVGEGLLRGRRLGRRRRGWRGGRGDGGRGSCRRRARWSPVERRASTGLSCAACSGHPPAFGLRRKRPGPRMHVRPAQAPAARPWSPARRRHQTPRSAECLSTHL